MSQSTHKQSKPITLRRTVALLKKQMPELSKRYRVKSLGVFGSYVRNEQSRRSDLDILVDFTQTPNLFEFMDLEEHLARALNVKVDLVPRHALRGEIGKRILSEVVAI
ncbi:MAG: nucleotidyltransferase family protein [Chloroflexi bacterium]|nr:nucleotidyltransferase family protein [Chloroflexota bacterium]